MSDIHGVEFTPEETAYFESGGGEPKPQEQEQAKPAEGAQDDKPAEKTGDKPAELKVEKVVPLPALQEERRKRQDVERRLRDIELENARYAERFRLVENANKPAQPTPAEDPFAYLEKVVPQDIQKVNERLEQYEQRERATHQQRQLLSIYNADVARFKTETPEFGDAYQFVVNGYLAEAQAMGEADPVAAANEHEMRIVISALQRGVSPAEAMYNVAKARGFKAKEPDKTASDKLDTIEKGQAANKSLASAGGTGGAENMTPEALLKMPLDEFESWTNKHPAQARKLLGGK